MPLLPKSSGDRAKAHTLLIKQLGPFVHLSAPVDTQTIQAGAKPLSNALATSTDEALLLAESAEQTEIIGKPNQIEAVMSQMEGRPAAYPDSP